MCTLLNIINRYRIKMLIIIAISLQGNFDSPCPLVVILRGLLQLTTHSLLHKELSLKGLTLTMDTGVVHSPYLLMPHACVIHYFPSTVSSNSLLPTNETFHVKTSQRRSMSILFLYLIGKLNDNFINANNKLNQISLKIQTSVKLKMSLLQKMQAIIRQYPFYCLKINCFMPFIRQLHVYTLSVLTIHILHIDDVMVIIRKYLSI